MAAGLSVGTFYTGQDSRRKLIYGFLPSGRGTTETDGIKSGNDIAQAQPRAFKRKKPGALSHRAGQKDPNCRRPAFLSRRTRDASIERHATGVNAQPVGCRRCYRARYGFQFAVAVRSIPRHG